MCSVELDIIYDVELLCVKFIFVSLPSHDCGLCIPTVFKTDLIYCLPLTGEQSFEELHQAAERIGFDKATGLHSTTLVDKPSMKGDDLPVYTKL